MIEKCVNRMVVYLHRASYVLSPDPGGDPSPLVLLIRPGVTVRPAPITGRLVADLEGGATGIPLADAIEKGWCRFEDGP